MLSVTMSRPLSIFSNSAPGRTASADLSLAAGDIMTCCAYSLTFAPHIKSLPTPVIPNIPLLELPSPTHEFLSEKSKETSNTSWQIDLDEVVNEASETNPSYSQNDCASIYSDDNTPYGTSESLTAFSILSADENFRSRGNSIDIQLSHPIFNDYAPSQHFYADEYELFHLEM